MTFRALIVAAVVLAAAPAAAAPAHHATLKVTSTLDGKTVLGRRVVWTVSTPGTPRSALTSGAISFLIDGKIRGFTGAVPGTYPDKGGYLVTTWLTPGLHTFTARVRAKSGEIVDDTVKAKVLPAAGPPTALAGTWQRVVTDVSGMPKPGSAGNPTDTITPVGKWTLVFDKRWIQSRFPGKFDPQTVAKTNDGIILDNDWTPGATTFQALGGVQFKVPQDIDAEGGAWCNAGGPVGTYTWSVSGETLTLAPKGGSDPCSIRGFIWAGDWTRVK